MPILTITSATGHARVSTQGAQVLDAVLQDQPLLWLSPLAQFVPGKSVRGGIPVCFPWFSKHPDGLPAHGFVRNREWTVIDHAADSITLSIADDAATRAQWPHAFKLTLCVTLADNLTLDWQIENRDSTPFRFTAALHNYFAVAAVGECRVTGLEGMLRREIGMESHIQQGAVLTNQPIDALFDQAPDTLLLHQPLRTLRIDSQGLPSAVVWNVGPAGTGVADIGPHWPEYLCVERGMIGEAAVTLPAGVTYRASMRLGWADTTAGF